MTAKTVNERQQAFKARMKAKGFKEVRNLWVPQDCVKDIQAAARAMCEDYPAKDKSA